MVEIAERITIDPQQCGGRPCIRGMRIRAEAIAEAEAAGLLLRREPGYWKARK